MNASVTYSEEILEGWELLLQGRAAEYIKRKRKRGKEITDRNIDIALFLWIKEKEEEIINKLNQIDEIIKNEPSLKPLYVQTILYNAQRKVGERLLELKEIVDIQYGTEGFDVLPSTLKDYLHKISLAESTARNYMYLASHFIDERFIFLGSDRIVQLITQCRVEKINDFNSFLEKLMEEWQITEDLEEEAIKDWLDNFIAYKRYKKNAKKNGTELPDNVKDAFVSGEIPPNNSLNSIKDLTMEEKTQYFNNIINAGQGNKRMKKPTLADELISRLLSLLIENRNVSINFDNAKDLARLLLQIVDDGDQSSTL